MLRSGIYRNSRQYRACGRSGLVVSHSSVCLGPPPRSARSPVVSVYGRVADQNESFFHLGENTSNSRGPLWLNRHEFEALDVELGGEEELANLLDDQLRSRSGNVLGGCAGFEENLKLAVMIEKPLVRRRDIEIAIEHVARLVGRYYFVI